jgi:hypothetical protein
LTPQQLIERAAKQPEVTLERSVRVPGPALRELLASGRAIPLIEMISHPDQHEEVRRFRYGHLLGPGASHAAIEDWQTRNPSAPIHPDLVELLTLVDGIHLWADLDRTRAYYGIRPLSEWTEVALSEWRFLFDEPVPGALVISYHHNGDYFLVLDTHENSFTWYDPQNFRDTRTVKHSVGELLDWWWELSQKLDPRTDAAGQLRLAADEGIANAQPSQLKP